MPSRPPVTSWDNRKHRLPIMPRKPVHHLVQTVFRLMIEDRWTYHDVASRAGITPGTIRSWKINSMPSLEALEAVLNTMGYELVVRKRKDDS